MVRRGRVRALIARSQHRLALAMGVDEQRRSETVMAMHANNARRAPAYWVQLLLSMGIATLGLVLDSTAVVIGAMLVSPLMGPIIELGMGFAVGSSLLVVRAFFRTAISAMVVVTGAAALTMALPFHEITREISTRGAPTALDLLVAIFCALAAAYTSVRSSADSTAAAAGTAIGIALVPPLCAAGFGLGTGALSLASGAALLFIANLSAIVVFAALAFLALGFDQVDAATIEGEYAEHGRSDRAASVAHRTLERVFGSRFGLAMRVGVPAAFLAIVAVPLARALDDVTWEVRMRGAIRRILEEEAPGAVQTSVTVERGSIVLRLLLIGSTDDAATAERRVSRRISEASNITPSVSVIQVADSRTLATAAKAEASGAPARAPEAALSEMQSAVGRALHGLWPAAAGRVVTWRLSLASQGPMELDVQHLGPPLGDVATTLLSFALSSQIGRPVRVQPSAIRPTALVRQGRDPAWVDSAAALIAAIAATDSLVACMRAPVSDTAGTSRDRVTLARLERLFATKPRQLVLERSTAWSVRAAFSSCADSTSGR